MKITYFMIKKEHIFLKYLKKKYLFLSVQIKILDRVPGKGRQVEF